MECQQSQANRVRWARPSQIVWDQEFANLMPDLSPDQREQVEFAVAAKSYADPLLVWNRQHRLILLADYERFAMIRQQVKPRCRIVELEMADRDEARMFVIQYHLGRKNLSSLAISYLRGLRYLVEKRPHGGDRKSEQYQATTGEALRIEKRPLSPEEQARRARRRRVLKPFTTHRTDEALAIIFGVSRATIRRDGEFAKSVKRLVYRWGDPLKPLLLQPNAPLGRDGTVALAKITPGRQRIVRQLLDKGKVSRSWRTGGKAAWLMLPVAEPEQMAEICIRRIGTAKANKFQQALGRRRSPANGSANGHHAGAALAGQQSASTNGH